MVQKLRGDDDTALRKGLYINIETSSKEDADICNIFISCEMKPIFIMSELVKNNISLGNNINIRSCNSLQALFKVLLEDKYEKEIVYRFYIDQPLLWVNDEKTFRSILGVMLNRECFLNTQITYTVIDKEYRYELSRPTEC